MIKKLFALVLSCFMIINFTACDLLSGKETIDDESSEITEETEVSGEMLATSLLASNLREKYGKPELNTAAVQEEIEFDGHLMISRDEPLVLSINANRATLGEKFDTVINLAGLYSDPQMTEAADVAVTIEEHSDNPDVLEGDVRITFSPAKASRYMQNEFTNPAGITMTLDSYSESYYAYEDEEEVQWPVTDALYFVKHADFGTLENFDKPEIYKVIMNSVLEAPKTEFYVNESGQASLKWERVQDAKYYVIAEKSLFGNGYDPIDVVTGTDWSYSSDSNFMNRDFNATMWTDDELADFTEEELEEYTSDGNSSSSMAEFTVIASDGYDFSPPGKFYDPLDYAGQLPYSLAYNATVALATEEDTDQNFAPSISLLPMYSAISMADGSTTRRARLYYYDKAAIVETDIFTIKADDNGKAMLDEDGNFILMASHPFAVEIPYSIEGTTFIDSVFITDYNESTYLEEVQSVKKYHESNQSRGGNLEYTFDTDYDEDYVLEDEEDVIDESTVKEDSVVDEGSIVEESTPTPPEKESKKENKKENKKPATEVSTVNMGTVFANSALSEYLALNMLSGNTLVDLTDFPESEDMDYLADALFEAMYQNPLVLGFASAGMLTKDLLIIEYTMDAATQAEMQVEILAEVDKIVSEVVTDGMTDLEKEVALNNYLCANSKYDTAALENAEKNDFKYTDPMFDNSFNAYGILVDKVGVCASYAASFKLLADAAELESIVVTGNLAGSLPHAWNRVNIDGEWHTIDVTNNDSEFAYNALFNISDSESAQLLIEDERYILDDFWGSYTSEHDDDEYYRITDQYFSTSDIAAELVKELEANGSAVLRTDYELDDPTFYAIAQEVIDLSGLDGIYGYYWLGLICLTTETP